MKAKPLKFIGGQMLLTSPGEATHVRIHLPGPAGPLVLPVITRGTRSGTACWSWNMDVHRPTLKPSVLVNNGHYAHQPGSDKTCWCEYNRQHPGETSFTCFRCHTWINDGQAQFLPDSTHEHAGKTLDLLDVE